MIEGLNKKFMRLAIEEARKNLKDMCGGPFGACIVRNGEVLAVSMNMVLKRDAASHAEINAIRIASQKLKNYNLSGCEIYSTNEPCPMCFSAIHWARVDTLIYGTGIKDAKNLGFNELNISNEKMRVLGKSRMKIFPHFLIKECAKLLKDWDNLEYKVIY